MARDAKGKFLPGETGNPGGKPLNLKKVRDLARSLAPEAWDTLRWAMSEARRELEPRVAVQAAQEILNRAYGKPPQTMTGEDGEGPAEIIIKWASE